MALALKSKSGPGNGIPYTDKEKALARQALTAALILGEIDCPKPLSNSDCTEIANEVGSEHKGIDTLTRAIFRGVIKKTNGTGKQFVPSDDFPKVRDPTSIQLLMRGAAAACGLDKATIDTAFPRYGGAKKDEVDAA